MKKAKTKKVKKNTFSEKIQTSRGMHQLTPKASGKMVKKEKKYAVNKFL